jgi:hypothetical protein
LAVVISHGNLPDPGDEPLPRPQRRRRRPCEDQGLPDDAELKTLAEKYLARARELWPELADAGILQESSDEAINRMVEEFKHSQSLARHCPDEFRKSTQTAES